MENTQKIINELKVSSNATDLHSLAADVTALKVAFGLMFQKMGDSHREALLKELRQTNTEALNDLANQLEQFRV
ncbi:hypothetical protein KIE59_004476 [Salmonella enterica]|uniref:hypothetical protein n=1 Tax=Salmonella enterica TaxID=28901 RepID=UPI000FC31FD6|nr:hypothetical protein [Salmonella enterica]EBS1888916.1 hypothetical protein [Salmonella enterica subsp. enterica serovar Havana]EBX8877518.1 hypothetical protein [Salmonella enterica subsp. enterica serovar Cubana]ECF7159902.1 hypothetical protein [Salmonella enterica subsp. enterica]ECG6622759.1 hypothetical protein [Salmonella enterica subsp. enterica serovar Manhattan]ECI2872332.1 hypothetical protein [Salmonella enterica subsp. enterica serovar Senftenberg]EDB8173601.1 hypothetical pro